MIEQFYRPGTVQEALGLKRKLKDRAVFLAGGTLVNSKDFPVRHEHVISLEGLKLNRISRRKGEVTIGALCTLEQLIESALIPNCLKVALRQVVSRNVRNMATIGGLVAAGKSCSDVLPMLIALEAEIEILKPSAKNMSLEDYLETRPDGLITQIVLPKSHLSRRQAFSNLRISANSASMLTVAVSLEHDNGTIDEPIIALGGVGRELVRLSAVEGKLAGNAIPSTDEIVQLVRKHTARHSCRPSCIAPCLSACIEENADYLQYESGSLVARALEEACREGGRS